MPGTGRLQVSATPGTTATRAGSDTREMYVAEIWRYPVKSMGGERLETADVDIDGIPGDRLLYVVDGSGEIVSARTRPRLLAHRATIDKHGDVLIDGRPWDSEKTAAAITEDAGPGARLVRATGPERFDILPLLVATDGAIAAFAQDHRRLRPNLVIGGVPGLAERTWEGRQLQIGHVIIQLATLRGRCITTTYDPDTLAQDVDVLRQIRRVFDGTLALNAWAGRPGTVKLNDDVRLLEAAVQVERPELGRFVRGPV